MTVCIAAICDDNDEEKIVLCSDSKVSSYLGSAEVGRKEFGLAEGWRCLTAGVEPDYLSLVKLHRLKFLDDGRLNNMEIDSVIKEPLFERKKQVAEEYIRKRFAISHDDFIQFGKDRLPADLFHEAIQKISQIDLGAELILAGFVAGTPVIYCTDQEGGACPAMHFSSVGEGANLAHSVLMRRGQNNWKSLSTTIYSVYEAKRYSEFVGSVGQQTNISVMSKDGKIKLTSLDLDKQLAAAYEKYGPQKLPRDLKFQGEYYYKEKEGSSDESV